MTSSLLQVLGLRPPSRPPNGAPAEGAGHVALGDAPARAAPGIDPGSDLASTSDASGSSTPPPKGSVFTTANITKARGTRC